MHSAVINQGQTEDVASDLPEITFIRPIPGFAGLTKFVLVRSAEEDSIISELRSLELPQVRFLVATPALFFSDYAIDLDQQDCDALELRAADEALILTVLTIGHDVASTTANLLAPVVINLRTKMAAQVILNGTEWPVRAPLGQEP